jgi:hypothetical protein
VPFVLNDRIKDTTATTGTGFYTLDNTPPTGFVTFATGGMINLDTTYYAVTDGTDWETGIGTYNTTSPPRMYRTQIISSTNSNNAVNWGAGTKTIVCTTPGKESTGMNLIGTYNFLGSSTLTIDNIFTDNLGYRAYKIIGRGVSLTSNGSTSGGLGFRVINNAGSIISSSSYTFTAFGYRVTSTVTGAATSVLGYNGAIIGGGVINYMPLSGFFINEFTTISGNDTYSPASFEMTVFNPRNNLYANSNVGTTVFAQTPYPNTTFIVNSRFNAAVAFNYTNPARMDVAGCNSAIYNPRGIQIFDVSGIGRQGAVDVYGLSGGRRGG